MVRESEGHPSSDHWASEDPESDQQSSLQPDILLIDGGKGQLGRALKAFELLQIAPPLVLSIAKREELIYRMKPDGTTYEAEPLRLSRNSYALRLLQYVRDESHRFAQHYHHLLRKKKMLDQ